MIENDYTGTAIDRPSSLDEILDDGFYEVAIDEDGDIPVDEDDDEIFLNVADTVNGASSLSEIATRLYDLADELLSLSDDGWEIVVDVADGHATIVRFAVDGISE
jgi:hypothetical protein